MHHPLVKKIYRLIKTHLSTCLFISGFLLDPFTLPDGNTRIATYMGIFYVTIISCAILAREIVITRNKATKTEEHIYNGLTFAIALLSGALLSYVFVYYERSAELSVSWPFFILFIGIMICHEFISTHHFRFMLDIAVLLIGSLFFSIFKIPLLLKEVSDESFVISVAIALTLSLLFIHILSRTSDVAHDYKTKLQALAVSISLTVSFFYFGGFIPAVPLALKEVGIYSYIERVASGDSIDYRKETLTQKKSLFSLHPHYVQGESHTLYFFSAVEAPSEIKAPLSHLWYYYNKNTNMWEIVAAIPFSVYGGREGGYRAFSRIENSKKGLWRVIVKAGERRVVGRYTFVIE